MGEWEVEGLNNRRVSVLRSTAPKIIMVFNLCLHLYLCLSVCMYVFMYVCLSVCLSVYLSVCLSVSVSHTHIHTHSFSLSLSLSLPHTYTLPLQFYPILSVLSTAPFLIFPVSPYPTGDRLICRKNPSINMLWMGYINNQPSKLKKSQCHIPVDKGPMIHAVDTSPLTSVTESFDIF